MIRMAVVALLALSTLLSNPESGSAQARQGPTQGQGVGGRTAPTGLSREQMLDSLQARYRVEMARVLRLTPEQSTALAGIFSAYAEPRRQIADEKRRFQSEVRAFRTGTMPEDRARAFLEQSKSLRQREARLLEEEEARLLTVLSPSQVLALQLYREQFGDRIRGFNAPSGPMTPGGLGGFRTR